MSRFRKIGLRIDVDTFWGTRFGVPSLNKLLAEFGITASFFFSVGPDNMGRHLWRLFRPVFLKKMLRSKAAKLYGWDILLKGLFWPGPVIGEKLGPLIRATAEAGHEIGLHAWDHYAWQRHLDTMSSDVIRNTFKKGIALLTTIVGQPPSCSAVPGWKCNDQILKEKTAFPFTYNSDCRGKSIFFPMVDGTTLFQPQIPVTLPTYDEVIGRKGISNHNYNDYILSLLQPNGLNVLTIHAEVEGMTCLKMFEQFLKQAQSKGATFLPLGGLLTEDSQFESASMIPKTIPGREGWVSCQATVF
jgi:undecaprenyl phosphate-alpha-L-ara4FN deformylase